jgi:hypothetical protein
LLIVEANPLAQSVMRALLQTKVGSLELVALPPQGLDR